MSDTNEAQSQERDSFNFKSVAHFHSNYNQLPRDHGLWVGIFHQSSDLPRYKLHQICPVASTVACGYSSEDGFHSLISRENAPGFLCCIECPMWNTCILTSQDFPVLCNVVGLLAELSMNALGPGNDGRLLDVPPGHSLGVNLQM